MVYKCALVCRNGKMKLVQSEKNSSELKKVCTYVHTFFTWNENFYSQAEKKITTRLVVCADSRVVMLIRGNTGNVTNAPQHYTSLSKDRKGVV